MVITLFLILRTGTQNWAPYQLKNKMKWNELKRQALKHGVRFVKHGKEHDEYYNPLTGVAVQI